MKLLDYSKLERPRERLREFGASNLTDGELLSILLVSGTKDQNVLDLSRSILSSCSGSLVSLSSLSLKELRAIPGIGFGKACTISACFELSRRFLGESVTFKGKAINNAADVAEVMRPRLKGCLNEECHLLLLDGSNRLIRTKRLSIGGLRSTGLEPTEVVQICLESKASGLVIVHNHPSGRPSPSKADIMSTSSVMEATSSCGIDLLDHVILCDESYYSFSDEKIVSF